MMTISASMAAIIRRIHATQTNKQQKPRQKFHYLALLANVHYSTKTLKIKSEPSIIIITN
jgi:hypothetical protein